MKIQVILKISNWKYRDFATDSEAWYDPLFKLGLEHGFETHGLGVWQLVPVKSAWHVHVYDEAVWEQTPLFKQGLERHGPDSNL